MIFGHEFALATLDAAWPEWALVIGCLAAIWVGAWILRPLATLLHELGHAVPALLLTNEVVEVRVGRLSREGSEYMVDAWRNLGRLHWVCSFRGGGDGFTGYDRDALNRWSLLAVIAGGPLISGLACGLGAWLCFKTLEEPWQLLIASSFLCSNAILFLRSVIPVHLSGGDPSDGMDFWITLRQTEQAAKEKPPNEMTL